ncbi:MAG TPA: ABC transporter ATP-binding protein [Haliangiales bacterium]|nr:ABC transporter ATP-binding protein [Haliangiales bacterium]
MSAILELRGVVASYGAAPVLHGVDITVDNGAVVALLGANGAGKTTTLRAICNVLVRVDGDIRFAGHRIDGKSTESIVRLGIGHVPEGRGTFEGLSVDENLRLGAYVRRDPQVAADFDRVFAHFPALAARRRQQAGTLSGGEQQMLAIGRALMMRPRLLLLDEPSFGLAPIVVAQIFSILAAINRDEGMSMLVVEQNAHHALALAEQVYLLETGRVVMSGPPSRIAGDAAVRRAYLGQ